MNTNETIFRPNDVTFFQVDSITHAHRQVGELNDIFQVGARYHISATVCCLANRVQLSSPSRSLNMIATTIDFESHCRSHLDRFFAAHPDAIMEKRAHKALRLLRASETPLQGKTEGWAAGIIYAVATDGRIPCGVPDILNADFERFMGVTMSTVRTRAARVNDVIRV